MENREVAWFKSAEEARQYHRSVVKGETNVSFEPKVAEDATKDKPKEVVDPDEKKAPAKKKAKKND